jgi:pyrimidine deaminase RibD-like protein
MSREEAEQGKAWIESLVRRLSLESGSEVTSPFEWHFDMDHHSYRMDVGLNGTSERWQFSAETLEDCANDKTVQRAIERSLAQYFIPRGQRPNATPETTGGSPRSAKDHPSEYNQTARPDDRKFAQLAIEEARKSVAEEDGRVHPKVGAVVVKEGHVLAMAHRGEFDACHAEYIALERKLVDTPVSGATVYTTLEPCTTRNHPKVPCASRLVERRVARVVIGMLDPNPAISGKGQRALRKGRIATELFPADLMDEVEELNREFTREHEREGEGAGPATPSPDGASREPRWPVATDPARASVSKPFRWEEIDHSLVALKLGDVSEDIRKEIETDERRIRFDNRNNMNAATVHAQLLEMHERRTDEWASRMLEVYRGVVNIQGLNLGADFLRAVYAKAITPLIDARTAAITDEFECFATRTGYSSQVISAQLQGFRQQMERLKGRWNRRLEAEAKELEHAVRSRSETTPGIAPREATTMQVVASVFSSDYNGFIIIVEFRNMARESEQLTEWTLEFPSLRIALREEPAGSSPVADVSRLPSPPFDVPARKVTRGAVFFPGPPLFKGALPSTPLAAVLTAHLFPAGPLQKTIEIEYIKFPLRSHPKLRFMGSPTWPPSWREKQSGRFALGELGALTGVRKIPPQYEIPDHIVLESEFNGQVWETQLRADDREFLASLYEKLRSGFIGKSMNEIGSLEIP